MYVRGEKLKWETGIFNWNESEFPLSRQHCDSSSSRNAELKWFFHGSSLPGNIVTYDAHGIPQHPQAPPRTYRIRISTMLSDTCASYADAESRFGETIVFICINSCFLSDLAIDTFHIAQPYQIAENAHATADSIKRNLILHQAFFPMLVDCSQLCVCVVIGNRSEKLFNVV